MAEPSSPAPSLLSFQQHQQLSSPTSSANNNSGSSSNLLNANNNISSNLITNNTNNVVNNSVVFMSPLQAKVEKLFQSIETRLQSFSHNTVNPTDSRRDQTDKSSELASFCTKIKKEFKNSIHGQVIEDLLKVATTLKTILASKEQPYNEILILTIVKETGNIVEIRKKLSTLYSALKFKTVATPSYADFISALGTLVTETSKSVTDQNLVRIQKNLSHELKILNRLLSLQWNISQLQFKESIVLLQEVRNGLDHWKLFLQQEQPQSGSLKQIYVGWSYGWLSQFYLLMYAKVNLYFYETLKQKEEDSGGDLKSFNTLLSKSEINFVSLIEIFVGKSEVYNFSLILQADKLTAGKFSKNGYSFELSSGASFGEDEPLGMRSLYPCIYSCPKQPPYAEHWPNIIGIAQQNAKFLSQFREPLTFFDRKVGCTYFLTKVDLSVLMVVIFQKKKDADTTTKDFLNHVADHIRLFKLFEELQ